MGKKITERNLRILLLSVLLSVMLCSAASGQAILTPTPDPDGNIFYIIKANDSCMSISLTMGIDLQTLRQLNNLDEECTLIAGTRLLLGRYETPTPTPGPSPTPTPIRRRLHITDSGRYVFISLKISTATVSLPKTNTGSPAVPSVSPNATVRTTLPD